MVGTSAQLSEPCTLKNPKRPSTGVGSFNFSGSFNNKPYFGKIVTMG
jgi:hypothetical protein